mgnify:CR=1 FL=1
MTHAPDPTPPVNAASRRRVCALLLGIFAATLVVHIRSLVAPALRYDDFVIVEQSLTWAEARANLWVPVNEHCWPVFRVATWAVAWAAGGAANLPFACALAVRLMLLGTVALVYRFVARERGHPFYGLVGAAVFGVTAVDQEAVFWYAAAPAVGAAAFTLAALLGAQSWVMRRSTVGLVGACMWSFLAPGWYAGGVLTGPLCALYLWNAGRRAAAAAPLAGTLAYLVVALSLSGDRILHADHHGGRTTAEAFDPLSGAVTTGRAVVDNLALGSVGVFGFTCPPLVAAVGCVLVLVLSAWWWRRAPRRDLVVLGVAFVVLHFGLVYGARAAWPYDTVLRGWSRYNLFPWLGVVLALVGGLRWLGGSDSAAGVTPREARLLGVMILSLMAANLPRGIVGTPPPEPGQADALARVDEVDVRCRVVGISPTAARGVLEPLWMPGDRGFSTWRLLRGGPVVRDRTDDEVRALLAVEN